MSSNIDFKHKGDPEDPFPYHSNVSLPTVRALVSSNTDFKHKGDPENPCPHPSKVASPAVHEEVYIKGNPGPFGLLCFGMTTDLLMFVITGWAEAAFVPTGVVSYATFFGGAGQFFAGMLELIKGNTFAGTAFSSYGCFWLGWFMMERAAATVNQSFQTAQTLYFGLWAFFSFGLLIPTLRKGWGLRIVFSTLVVTFALLAGGVHNETCNHVAGYMGFLCGSTAIYTAFAMLYKDELGWALPGL